MKLSVIIPVYNEERTVSSIVEIVRSWGKAEEIILVNDGSTDQSLAALAQFKPSIKLISYQTNRGKGYALARSIAESSGEVLMFLDADLVGLTHADLEAMLKPLSAGRAEMVLGLARFWSAGGFEPFNEITGERVLLRRNVAGHLKSMKKVGYGVELLLNDLHKGKKVVSVRLPHVFILGKLEKQSVPAAMLTYIKEARELLTQVVRQQTDDLTPQAKNLLAGIAHYLKQALEYFQ